MDYQSVEEIFASIEASRAKLRERLEALDEESGSYKSSAQAWSAAEIAEHLSAIEKRMLGLLSSMLDKAESDTASVRKENAPFAPVSLTRFTERSRAEKFIAPGPVRPQGSIPIATSLASLQQTREALVSLRPRIEPLDLSAYTFPHPAFGPLNFYEWLLFIGAHEERHLRQIERTLAENLS